MSCYICNRGACAVFFHSIEERNRFAKVIELFEKAEELRKITHLALDEDAEEKEQNTP